MTWSWIYGCCAYCTWQEMAMVCGLAVLTMIIWWTAMSFLSKKNKKEKEDR